MYIEEGLEILVKEWTELLSIGETYMPVAEVVKKLGGDNWMRINDQLTPGQTAELIEEAIGHLGLIDKAETFMGRFSTEDDLLAATSLYTLICDICEPEEYPQQPEEYLEQRA